MSLGYEIIPLLILKAHLRRIHSHGCCCRSFHCVLSHSFSPILYILRPDRSHHESWPSRLIAVVTFVLRRIFRFQMLRVLHVQQVLFFVWVYKKSSSQRLLLWSELFFLWCVMCCVIQGIFNEEKYTSKISYRKCSQVSKMASRHRMDSASADEQTYKGRLFVKEKSDSKCGMFCQKER